MSIVIENNPNNSFNLQSFLFAKGLSSPNNDIRDVLTLNNNKPNFYMLAKMLGGVSTSAGITTADRKYTRFYTPKLRLYSKVIGRSLSATTGNLTLSFSVSENKFREGVVVYQAFKPAGTRGRVVSASPGQIIISPIGRAFTSTDFVVGAEAVYGHNTSPYKGSKNTDSYEESLNETWNYSEVTRKGCHIYIHEMSSTYIQYDGADWYVKKAKDLPKQLMEDISYKWLYGQKYHDTTGNITYTGGLLESIENTGFVRGYSSQITEAQFIDWITGFSKYARTNNIVCATGQDFGINFANWIGRYLIGNSGNTSTFGGGQVQGWDIPFYQIGNIKVMFMPLDEMNDQERHPLFGSNAPSYLSSSATLLSSTAILINGDTFGSQNVIGSNNSVNSPMLPFYWGQQEVMAFVKNGLIDFKGMQANLSGDTGQISLEPYVLGLTGGDEDSMQLGLYHDGGCLFIPDQFGLIQPVI